MTQENPDSVMSCPINHDDATCEQCGAEHVVVGWAHVCASCFASTGQHARALAWRNGL